MNKTVPTENSEQHAPAEANVYVGVYRVLLGGMLASTILFLVAIVRALLRPEFVPLTTEWIKQHYHWDVILRGLMSFDPPTIMLAATALLILTPVARVLVSIYAFVVDRDWKFVAVTSIVLLVMIATVSLGLAGLK